MPSPVAVIIPTRNEEATIETAINSAWVAGADEVIVSDGGSTDQTVARASSATKVLTSETIRGRQLNAAARQSRSRILLFLHADSELAPDSLRLVDEAVRDGYVFGGFRIRFREQHFALKVAAELINLRASITKCPWGDQAQFISRDVFLEEGGFKEYPLMEDYDLAVRMKRKGRTILMPEFVITSGRRFLEVGFLRTPAINWRIVLAYRLGADPSELKKVYRGD